MYICCLRDSSLARIHTDACLARQLKGRCPGCKEYDDWWEGQVAKFDDLLKEERHAKYQGDVGVHSADAESAV
jgi:hypothetical protein